MTLSSWPERVRLRYALIRCIAAAALLLAAGARAEDIAANNLALDAQRALKRATTFFREEVAVQGSYVWRYSKDLSIRMGEAEVTPTQGWAQPPGTPAVGFAYVKAYEATGDQYYLDAAVETALALAATQLHSGGWQHVLEFDPQLRRRWCYRIVSAACDKQGPQGENRLRNATTLDDDITQSALRLLIVVDILSRRKNEVVREAAEYGLERFLNAQYPNGAWPIRFDRRVSKRKRKSHPGTKARYPDVWARKHTKPTSREIFVLNDHVLRDSIQTLLLAHRHYGDGRYLQAAMRAGDFLLVARMPGPQPGWAQSYNSGMEPMWGRTFEPPSIASWETATTIDALLTLYLYTGEERFLEAVHPAVKWLDAARLSGGLWARFYELETNRPLYVTREGALAYDNKNVRAGYGFQGDFGIPNILARYRAIVDRQDDMTAAQGEQAPSTVTDLQESVTQIIGALDSEGRWAQERVISSQVFIDNVAALSDYIATANGRAITLERLQR